MFQILVSVSSDGKFYGKCDAPVSLKRRNMNTGCSVCFIYLYLFTLHVFYFNIPDLQVKAWGRESVRGQNTHTVGTRLSLNCSIFLCLYYTFLHMCMYACENRLLPGDCQHDHTYTHKLFIWAVSASIWVGLETHVMAHTVCSVLCLSVPQGGYVQDVHLIWLAPCFLVYHHGSSLLNSLDLSSDRQESFAWTSMSKGITKRDFTSLSLETK